VYDPPVQLPSKNEKKKPDNNNNSEEIIHKIFRYLSIHDESKATAR
jgi:hypothetical protein